VVVGFRFFGPYYVKGRRPDRAGRCRGRVVHLLEPDAPPL